MTAFGINTSFANWNSRLPLFADPLRRGKIFEVFKEDGTPTGEPSPLGADGWPVMDGRWHGVRLFGDQDGFMPDLSGSIYQAQLNGGHTKFRINPGKSAFVYWKEGRPRLEKLKPHISGFHTPSLEALNYFNPTVLRTLDWGYQARKEKRPDWSKPRVLPTDPLQGEEMAVELHCEAANLLKCHLWWNAPPRFELSVAEYEERLEAYLRTIAILTTKPHVLEYGNELWNSAFPVHGWLARHPGAHWTEEAADEIATMKRVADRVFGHPGILGQKPYFLFVGGHIAVPDTFDKILSALAALGVTPDLAGPALYATPLKVDRDRWQQTGEVPTQDQLKESMLANLPALATKLLGHKLACKSHGVPYLGVYEAGQSMIANGRPWKAAAIEAQRSEWLGGIYRELRKMCEDEKVTVANWYAAASDQNPADARVDCFGLLEATLDKAEPLPKAKTARGGA